jgi:thiamine-phosphate pyrophosphorylase
MPPYAGINRFRFRRSAGPVPALSARWWGSRSVNPSAAFVAASCQTGLVSQLRQRLDRARLYLVCDAREDEFLEAALRGGVDIVQLRVKESPPRAIEHEARRFRRRCQDHRALFIVNDHPQLAAEVDADGVHLGQDDASPAEARRIVGPDRLIGLSTHTPDQIDAASEMPVDYIGVGPINETPTKPGRPAVGLELVRHATTHAGVPFFAIGGISSANVAAIRTAGARRIAVVRALTEASDPEREARELRRLLTTEREASVGAA